MFDFKHILVPTDFGEAAGHATDLALNLAKKYGAKVTLVHAFFVPALAYGDGWALPIDEMLRSAEDAVGKALAKAKDRFPNTEALIVKGEAWEQILGVAKDRRADLIVMGTHGRRGLSHVFLGSVAEKVVRLSPIPVLTVTSPEGRREKETALTEHRAL